MAKIANFFEKFNVMAVMLMACIVTLISSCDKADVGDEALRTKSTKSINYTEKSSLTTDDYQGTAILAISSEKFVGEESQGKLNGDATAKCTVSVENDPVETANMHKTFSVGQFNTANQNGNTVITCDIIVYGAGQENVLKIRTVIEPTQVWDNTYSIKVTKVAVNNAGVKIVETSKKSGESGRQAVSVPVVFTLEAVGTKEAHTAEVIQNAVWEQYQLENTPVIDHEEIAGTSWKVNADGTIDYMVKVKQIWTEGHEDTFVEYPYASTYVWNVISLEDMTVKSWAYGLKNIEGLTAGTPAAVPTGKEFFTEKRREDIYSAIHANGQDANIKCVYFCEHPEVTFTKGDLTYTFNFISPSFSENGDDLLDGTSAKSGYDLRIFRNSVTGKYGNQTTSIQEKVLEERCNLYKIQKAVSDVEFSNMKKSYSFGAIQYDVDCIDVYNDGTKSEKYHVTTSRPWSINYQGAWSMNTDKDVTEVIDAIKVSKTKTHEADVQNISNGKWTLTQVDYDVKNNTTVAGTSKENYWKSEKFPAHMILTIHGKTCDFGEDVPTGTATGDKIELTSSTATEETYTFTETLNFKVGDYTHKTDATGVVKKAVEVTVKSWSWENAWQRVEGNLTKAHVEKVYVMTDGSKKTIVRDFSFTRGSQVFTYWETTEANNSETTGAAQFSIVSTEAKSEGDWKFNVVNTQLSFGVACANSNQKDGWNIVEANNLSVEIDGDVYTFPAMDYSATANASQSKTAETDNLTTYTHSNAPTYIFGGSSMTLGTAQGKIFVAKVVTPDHHDGFFPKEYGKMEGYNRVACRNPHNQKDYGVGISVKFTNGSICGFITKDGNLEWGSFETGSTTWDGASPDSNGTMMNVTAKDASTAMKWMRNSTINMLSYSDGTLMGFNWGHNTVYTDKFGGNIEQKDGGKWQILTISGVNGSWDSSY